MMNRRTALTRLGTAALAGTLAFGTARAAGTVTVFAAASLKTALDAVSQAWAAETQKQAIVSYAASPALARQIEAGAPADVFISADMDWMNSLVQQKLIVAQSVVRLLGNRIVLVAPQDSQAEIAIEQGFDLAGLLGEGRLAMADVKSVPAGKYGRAALESLGVWASVEGRLAMAENVRAALKLVAIGEAALGIVYATDARAEPGVTVLGTFPPGSHPEIIYPVGLVAASGNADAAAFVSYLQGERAQAIFRQQGFTVPAATAN